MPDLPTLPILEIKEKLEHIWVLFTTNVILRAQERFQYDFITVGQI